MGAQGRLDGPLKWYRSLMRGFNNPDDEGKSPLPLEVNLLMLWSDMKSSPFVTQPTLLLVGDRDPSSIASSTLNDTLPFVSNVRVRTVDTGHFMQLEAPNEVNKHLHTFIQDVEKLPESGISSIAVHFEDYQRASA